MYTHPSFEARLTITFGAETERRGPVPLLPPGSQHLTRKCTVASPPGPFSLGAYKSTGCSTDGLFCAKKGRAFRVFKGLRGRGAGKNERLFIRCAPLSTPCDWALPVVARPLMFALFYEQHLGAVKPTRLSRYG